MIYYQKNNSLYYQLDSGSFTFTEVFNTNDQKRVMRVTGEAPYNATYNRITGSQFDPSTEEDFNTVKTTVLGSLS